MRPVLPSPLQNTEQESSETKFFGDLSLKIGQVIRINYPDPGKAQTTQTTTYDIIVNQNAGDGAKTDIYYGAQMSNIFGGLADYVDYTARTNSDKGQFILSGQAITEANYDKILGSHVIIACIDGSSTDSVIVGALPHYLNTIVNEKTYKKPIKADGHFLNFMFNGVNININKNGELLIKKGGPTNAKGALDEDNKEGGKKEQANSFIQIDKAGKILLSTTNKEKIEEADNLITINKDGSINIKIKDGKTLEIKDKDGDAKLTLGDGAKSVAIAEALEQLWNKLKQQCDIFDNHLHSTGMGPSGPPTPTLSAPGWDSNIISKTMKLPK